ncbi:hypothetical protein AB0Q95_42855 [Streptomyces sp. NPDC059900]
MAPYASLNGVEVGVNVAAAFLPAETPIGAPIGDGTEQALTALEKQHGAK